MSLAGADVIYLTDLLTAIQALLPMNVVKQLDTPRPSTTALSPDPELLLTVPATTTYTMLANISYSGDAGADLKGGIYLPSGGSINGAIRAQNNTASTTSGSEITDVYTGSTGFQFGCIGTTALTALIVATVNTGIGGNIGFTWSQVATSATATIVKAGSFITLFPTR